MVAQLPPGPDFKKFFEGADAAGKRQKCIRMLGHQALAFVHRLHHMQLGAAKMSVFLLNQSLWNHANHPPTGIQCRVGHGTHQSIAATAVDQLAAMRAYPGADLCGNSGEFRVMAGARATINAN